MVRSSLKQPSCRVDIQTHCCSPPDQAVSQLRSSLTEELGPAANGVAFWPAEPWLLSNLQHSPACMQAEKKKKWEPPAPPPRVGRKQRRRGQGAELGSKLPTITPNAKCKLRMLKLERVKDWLLMEEEFVQNQERLKPQEERNEEDRSKVRLKQAAQMHIVAT